MYHVRDRRCEELSGQAVGKGAAYIFIETAIGLLSGYLLWITLARIASPEIIGTSSAAISIATMFATIATMGIPTGVSRFLAKSFYEKNLSMSRRFVYDSVVLIFVGILGSVLLLFVINEWFYVTLDRTLLIFVMLLIGASTIAKLFNSVIVASLDTRIIPIVMLIVASTRTILVIVLVLMNTGAIGVLTGYVCFEVLSSTLLAIVVLRMLRTANNSKDTPKISHSFKSVLNASIPFWIPKLITVLS